MVALAAACELEVVIDDNSNAPEGLDCVPAHTIRMFTRVNNSNARARFSLRNENSNAPKGFVTGHKIQSEQILIAQ
jgi:hypothetical protein